MGFGVNYGCDGIKLNSRTFNKKLNEALDGSDDYKAMEFFTPILQVIMRKYKIEKCVGFDIPVEFVPIKIFNKVYAEAYPDVHLSFNTKEMSFNTEEEFYQWCRKYYFDEQNTNDDFKKWFLEGTCCGVDLDFFTKFGIYWL